MGLFNLKPLLFLLSLIGSCVGGSILPKGPVDVRLGSNLTLNILVQVQNGDIISWTYSDGTNRNDVGTVYSTPPSMAIDDAYKGRAFINSTNGYLTLLSLKSEDSGDYSVDILNPSSTKKTAEVKVRVLEPVSGVVIKSDKIEALEHATTVILTCTARGSFLKFTWLNNTAPIVVDGDRLSRLDTVDSSSLTIRDVLRSDLVGPIYCKAENTLESNTSAPFSLAVFYGPEDVKLSSTSSAEYVPSKSDVNLTCTAKSSPPPTFSWYQNKNKIENTGAVLTLATIEKLGLGKTMADYTCTAANQKTGKNATSPAVKLSVMEPIKNATIAGPTGTLIANNGTANLNCTGEGGIVKEVTWLKDGKTLTATDDLVFSTDMSAIRFNTLKKEDNGQYTCKLTNPVSSKEAVYKMVVNYGPEDVMVKGVKEAKLDTGVTLACSASSIPPASFTWKMNTTDLRVNKDTIAIDKAAYKDSGSYICEAYNSITGKKATSSHILTVKAEINEGLSDGAIAGIVIACLVGVAAVIALFFYCRQKVPTTSPY